MIKEPTKDILFYPFFPGENNLKNIQSNSFFNNEEKSNLHINDNNKSLKREDSLIEENNENENEFSEENAKDFINKKIIDLSFLDSTTNEPEESNLHQNKINENSSPSLINCNNEELERNENKNISEYIPGNLDNNRELYKMIILKNIYQNYNYYQQLAHINNLMLNYQNMNYQSKTEQVNCKKNMDNQRKNKKNIDEKYLINLRDIKTNKEKRTTIRMMNIPSYFRPSDLAKKLDEKFGISPQKENRVYDFIYIPFKENRKKEGLINSGYAFINFVHPKHILKFYSFFHGKHLKLKTSGKVCIITFASRQGSNIKYKGFEQTINDKYMYFTDTKNHFQLLTD